MTHHTTALYLLVVFAAALTVTGILAVRKRWRAGDKTGAQWLYWPMVIAVPVLWFCIARMWYAH
jgi:hypothetical protein